MVQAGVGCNLDMPRPLVLTLRKDLSRTLRQGHPWVFREAVTEPRGVAPGAQVTVADRRGREIAFGYYDDAGPIAVRVLALAPVADRTALLRDRLRAALAARRAYLDLKVTNAFRWVHGEADRLPGIHVDVYADVVSVRFDGEGARAFYRDLPALIRASADDLAVRKVIDRDARAGRAEEVEVRENGALFIVDVGRGQKGGLFLDQRENRQTIAQRAAGKSVLNLFGYTGGFSLHAARAGATRTDTVDIARPAIAAARRTQRVSTLLGRMRALPEINAKQPQARNYAERIARNTPIQGSAADILKLAMLRVQRGLDRFPKVRLLLTVHDELVFEVPEADLEAFRPWVKLEMEAAYELNVPLVVDVHTGATWGEAHS